MPILHTPFSLPRWLPRVFIVLLTLALAGASQVWAQSSGDDDPPDDDAGDEETVVRLEPVADFYGVNFIAPYEPWMTLARESGSEVVRWQFNWRDHELSPGEWVWTAADEPIQVWTDNGFKIHAILHNPPDFALERSGGLMPTGRSLPWNHPDNGFGNYCNRFAARYRGRIASYEIWNEPDLNQYWEGTARDYFDLLKSCYQAIKAADPQATVSMAGMALLIEPNFFPDVVRYAANDADGRANNHYFDAVSIHLYAAPQLAYDLTVQTRSVLEAYGMDFKPIWITEAGVALQGYGIAPNSAQWGYATEDEAAWYLIAMISNAYAARAERVMWFRLADDGMTEAFGLVRSDGSLRPSYNAWRTATALIHDIVEVSRETRNGVVITDLRRADGARIVTMYSVTGNGRNLSIAAEAPAGVVINAIGGNFAVQPDADGEYAVYVPEARGRDFSKLYNYSMGGPPLILLEFDKDPPSAQIQAAEIEGDKKHVLLRWLGDDGEFGTGVQNYDVEVSRDEGLTWELWQNETIDTQGVYDVSAGGVFLFRARATDRSSNTGPYSDFARFSNQIVGTLIAQITDLRGQSVPFARIQLSDGSLHDAGPDGWLRIQLPPGIANIQSVDGSAHGTASPEPIEIFLGQETQTQWMLLPRVNIIPNSSFDLGLQNWNTVSPLDAQAHVTDQAGQGQVLRLNGGRRPWGTPGASVIVDVPGTMRSGALSFNFRNTVPGGQTLRIRAVTQDGQWIVWQTNAYSREFARAWVDMSDFAGQRVALIFELWGSKGAPAGVAEIDDVIYGDVPVLSQGDQ